MDSILHKILGTKRQEIAAAKQRASLELLQTQIRSAPPPRNFLSAIKANPDISLIAEIKKASPSKGLIREDFDPVAIATDFESSGATCISVLTDESFFQGHLSYLSQIRDQVQIPVLRKDFIIDPYQVYQARIAGADAVLLIAECLDVTQLRLLHDLIVELGMTPLVELHDATNLNAVLSSGAQLVGINNRNLETFETDLNHCLQLRLQVPPEITLVGESGIFTTADVDQLRQHKIDAMLVGESLMKSTDIRLAVRELMAH